MMVYICSKRRRTSIGLSQIRCNYNGAECCSLGFLTYLCKQWHQCIHGNPWYPNSTLQILLSCVFLDIALDFLFFFRQKRRHRRTAFLFFSHLNHNRTGTLDTLVPWISLGIDRVAVDFFHSTISGTYAHTRKRRSWGSFVLDSKRLV